jgi:hypothetical protein
VRSRHCQCRHGTARGADLLPRWLDDRVQQHARRQHPGAAIEVRRSQRGRGQQLKNLDDHQGHTVLEQSIMADARVKNQTPAPGGEHALLKSVADLARGDPNCDQIVPDFAQVIRQELDGLHKFFVGLGPVQSAAFKRVLPGGTDVYSVTFQHGSREMEILLAPDGRIYSMNYN